ncbi:MAG: hypothetical protein AAFR79_04635 [Pseudomonadota bacterium]
MATAVSTRAATALSTVMAFFAGGSASHSDTALLLSKTPDQREDLGLSLADIRAIRR